MTRCADCLDDIPENGPEWMILKRMRDIGHEIGDVWMAWLDYDAVRVCEDCAGWYGDDAIEVAND